MKNIVKFDGHKNANCHMEIDGDDIKLISYTTEVATLKDDWLTINGLYSNTTRTHISWFMNYLGYNYKLAKDLYFRKCSMNVVSGEVRESPIIPTF